MYSHAYQLSLFSDQDFLDVKFPQPQYLGAKYAHRNWIAQFIPSEASTVLDGFSGSQSIAFMCKQLGKKVISNDFLQFNGTIGKALIENTKDTLSSEDIEILFAPNSDKDYYNLMESLFTDLFFVKDEAMFLDAFRSNVRHLDSEYKQALALTIMNRAMTRKVTMGHFAHTQALSYASDPQRIKRNRSLIRPLRDIFLDLLPEYNLAVFDNCNRCKSYCTDILDLLPTLSGIDLAYFDPPYCDSHADYQAFYHLLETYTVYWKDKDFINGTKRYSPKRHSGFDTKKEVINNINTLFELSRDIPYWLISYNDRSYPDIDAFVKIILPHRNVETEYNTYTSGRGGKGSVAGSSEVLFVCTPKTDKFTIIQ